MPSTKIREKIRVAAPELSCYFDHIPNVNVLEKSNHSVIHAISNIVVGQMLSRAAACTIIQKCESLASLQGKHDIAMLSCDELRSCGISSSKVKTIKLFAEKYYIDSKKYEEWHLLSTIELFDEVMQHWGLGDWTASMLALFYFAHEDVYPTKDGSIQRVTKLLSERGIYFDPNEASPYRSYLALYLWKILDSKIL